MVIKNTESSHPQKSSQVQKASQAQKPGDGGAAPPAYPSAAGAPSGQSPGSQENRTTRGGNAVFKSGPLFISSKGIGWTSWKKRWFILTHTSLVFFRSDPSAIPQKGNEVNLTLGGIDLNNSGSVVVKAEKKLLTVLFPDGRDGRAFTLKAETLEDLYEWKTALENALAQAPSTTAVGQNGILKKDQAEAVDGSSEQSKDKPVKFPVIGRPILLALEDVDGTPSFLEKALRFIEEHGVKVEGILRQAADVDDVNHRIREYEQGKIEFSPEEDPHVVADCVKYVIRELPSSPVPASCCNALLEARRVDRSSRVNALRTAICDTFPEPNRRLLQRILTMMQTISSNKVQNRMSTSAVAACMAPLLLRPLLAGECEIETDFDVGCDGSAQLLQAAAAANHAQAIVITLLEEYDKIFGEGSISPDFYSDSEESGSESEEATDDDESYDDDEQDDESDAYTDDDLDNASGGSGSESGDSKNDVLNDNKNFSSGSNSPERDDEHGVSENLSSSSHHTSLLQHGDVESGEDIQNRSKSDPKQKANESIELLGDVSSRTSSDHKSDSHRPKSSMQDSTTISNGPLLGSKRPTVWGRTAAKRKLSMESIDCPLDDEDEIQRLKDIKSDLQREITNEVNRNGILEASLEKRKKALREHRLALENDVARLQDQLQKEIAKRKALEAGLSVYQGTIPIPETVDEKIKGDLREIAQAVTDIINLKQRVDDLGVQLNQQLEKDYGSARDSRNQHQQTTAKLKDKERDNQAPSTASNVPERSTSKGDANQDGAAESQNDKKGKSTSLPSKHQPQNQQLDSIQTTNSKPTAPTNSKKSSTRGEGSSSTSFALTKLTTRLNFLKERRSQIACELQNMDKSRVSGQTNTSQDKGKGSESQQSTQNQDKAQGSEVQPLLPSEKGRERDSSQSIQNLDQGVGTEGLTQQNPGKSRKSNNQTVHYEEGGKRSEVPRPQSLDRGNSEGHVSYDMDKTQGGGHPHTPARTYSR